MASTILPPAVTPSPATYRLPETVRQAILVQSPAAQKRFKIERQRMAFANKFGSDFGLVQQ